MKKEFSFYEFAGIITPSVVLLYFGNFLIQSSGQKPLFNFSEIGQSIVFLMVAYAIGHVLHLLGYGSETL